MAKQISHSKKRLAILALVIVALGYVFLNVAVRLMGNGFGPITQTYMRLGGGTLISAFILRKNIRWRKLLSAPKKDYLILFIMGTIGYSVGVYFITLGALQTPFLNISVIQATMPFIVMIYAAIVLREKLQKKLFLFLLISFLGVAIVSTNSFIPVLRNFSMGDLFVLLAAASWGWYSICRKLVSPFLNNSEITIIIMPIAFLSALLFAIFAREPFSVTSLFNPEVLLGLLLGSGLNLVSAQFENFGFQQLEVVAASQILLLENFFAPFLGYLFYHELVSFPEVVGALLIVSGVYLANKFMKN